MNDPVNPFEPPRSEWATDSARPGPSGVELAGLGTRLAAALLDTVILLAMLMPLQFAFGVYDGFPKVKLDHLDNALWALGGFTLWIALNGYLIAKQGQTLGKRIFGIQIVNVADTRPASFSKIVFLRALPIQIVAMIPFVGTVAAFVDPLMIFRKDRRCLHDHIAGTRVVVVDRTRR
jgi:uncharacterized RDD family membrane protein YckC